MAEVTYIKLFIDYLDAIEPLGDAERGRLFTSLLEYARSGASPQLNGNERFLFPMMRAQIDRDTTALEEMSVVRSEAGKKGGRPKKQTKAKKAIAFSESKKSKDKEEDKDKDYDYDNIEKNIKKEIRHQYGQYNNVLLSDTELEKLKSEFSDYEQRIERLSEYIASTGKTYKNHLATIRSWSRRDNKSKDDSTETKQSYDIDFLDHYWNEVPKL